jgi:hypothetical protein
VRCGGELGACLARPLHPRVTDLCVCACVCACAAVCLRVCAACPSLATRPLLTLRACLRVHCVLTGSRPRCAAPPPPCACSSTQGRPTKPATGRWAGPATQQVTHIGVLYHHHSGTHTHHAQPTSNDANITVTTPKPTPPDGRRRKARRACNTLSLTHTHTHERSSWELQR